jgi:hypothetical protein
VSQGLLSRVTGLLDRVNGHERRLVSLERAPWLAKPIIGGTFTSTPGAVAVVQIAHGFVDPSGSGLTPVIFMAQAANANAGAGSTPTFYVTADATNITLHFASNLTAATVYSWNWLAKL